MLSLSSKLYYLYRMNTNYTLNEKWFVKIFDINIHTIPYNILVVIKLVYSRIVPDIYWPDIPNNLLCPSSPRPRIGCYPYILLSYLPSTYLINNVENKVVFFYLVNCLILLLSVYIGFDLRNVQVSFVEKPQMKIFSFQN